MHTYIKHKDGSYTVWTVGHYRIVSDPVEDGVSSQEWVPMKDFNTESEAAAYTNFLNGGDFGSLKLAT